MFFSIFHDLLVLAIKKTAPAVSAQNDPAVFLEADNFWFLLINNSDVWNSLLQQACGASLPAKNESKVIGYLLSNHVSEYL